MSTIANFRLSIAYTQLQAHIPKIFRPFRCRLRLNNFTKLAVRESISMPTLFAVIIILEPNIAFFSVRRRFKGVEYCTSFVASYTQLRPNLVNTFAYFARADVFLVIISQINQQS